MSSGEAVALRPRRPLPSSAVVLGVLGALGVTVWAGLGINFSLGPLVANFANGRDIIARFLSPNWAYLPNVPAKLFETLQMGIIATFVGCLLALGVALLTSKVSAPPAVVYVTKPLMSVVRSLPDVAYALVFVAALSVGPVPGILALILFNIGIVAKLTGETIDAIDPGPLEALDAAAATRWQRARVAIIPQILPNYLSYCLYVFELNIRASLVLGYVGAGGIGQIIKTNYTFGRWENLSVIVAVLFVVVVLIDLASQELRRRLV